MADKYDLVVIGAGPGGYVAAIRAAQLGLKTAVVERERAGGICLNWGCIPSKALLKSADAMRHVQHAADYGVIIKGEIGFDWDKIIKRSRGVADKLAGGVEFLFKKYGVTQILGTAKLTGRGKIEVETTAAGKVTGKLVLETPRTIIATGARAKFLPGIEPDGDRVITYREAMVLPEVPKSVVVIGAGAIGIEFADFWNAFGVEVTVIEYMPRVLPIEDEEISASLTRTLKKRKMTIHTGAKTTGVKVSGKTVTTSFTDADGKNQTVTSERVLLAVGVRANIENIGLEGMGVALDRGFIQVDDAYKTTSPGIWAIGDCAGPPLLAHVAMAEGVRTVEAMAGKHVVPDQLRRDPRLHLLRPRGRVDRQDRGAGARGRHRHRHRQVPVRPQRQGAGRRPHRRLHQGDHQQGARRDRRRPRHRLRRHRPDRRDVAGDDVRGDGARRAGGRPPPPDAVRGHVRSDRGRAGRGRPHLMRAREPVEGFPYPPENRQQTVFMPVGVIAPDTVDEPAQVGVVGAPLKTSPGEFTPAPA